MRVPSYDRYVSHEVALADDVSVKLLVGLNGSGVWVEEATFEPRLGEWAEQRLAEDIEEHPVVRELLERIRR